jgi:diguanylate cyclase (GGDEF)-like protein
LLPGIKLNNALKIARDCEQVVAGARHPHPASSVAPHVSVSIGVTAMVPIPDKSSSILVEQAEIALYQAKRQRQFRISAFEGPSDEVQNG